MAIKRTATTSAASLEQGRVIPNNRTTTSSVDDTVGFRVAGILETKYHRGLLVSPSEKSCSNSLSVTVRVTEMLGIEWSCTVPFPKTDVVKAVFS